MARTKKTAPQKTSSKKTASPKTAPQKTVQTLTHTADKRKNIPTAEHESVMTPQEKDAKPIRYQRNTDLDPQLVWRGKDEQDWSDLVVHAPPLYIQEKVKPKVLIDDLLRLTKQSTAQAPGAQADLFADFNGIAPGVDKTEFYKHEQNWTNRMILGDSLQVMASLAEREGLRGKVQCIYLDPPYGIKFNSNFQWSTTSRDVKDGNASHITREPEQVKAFRDTWRDGIHSYLTYLRDRLTVARDLLADSGSIFVQIGDENVHRVRAVLDEVFGEENFVSVIAFQKTGGFSSSSLDNVLDFIVCYAKRKENLKFRQLFGPKESSKSGVKNYSILELEHGVTRPLTRDELSDPSLISVGLRHYGVHAITSSGSANEPQPFEFNGIIWDPKKNEHWKAQYPEGMKRLATAGRIEASPKRIGYKRYFDDFAAVPISNLWNDTRGDMDIIYVVQTTTRIIERCLLMTTDPGDLVLDPTCGSGTTAHVAEQWGRRWITIDTSRVALALARARIMGARYPYYLLADSIEGQLKEAEITRGVPSSQPAYRDIRHGFVYERVPHITLKSIANNAEIDVIWEKWQQTLEPLRQKLNSALKREWQEWEIPREAEQGWPQPAQKLHADWWKARIGRQQEIDKSIAAKAEFEYLYDKPYENKKSVRVAGPFTVESLSPHRMLGVDENGEMLDPFKIGDHSQPDYAPRPSFEQMILENLRTAGVQQAHKEDRISFTTLTPWPGDLVCAEGRYQEGATQRRAAIFIGPEFGTVQRADLVAAARESGDGGFDLLIACAFNYEAHAAEFTKLGRIPVLKARMNADLHMAADLKNTGKGNLFVIFGEPDVEVASGQWLVNRNGNPIASFEQVKEVSGFGSLEQMNHAGRGGLAAAVGKTSGGKDSGGARRGEAIAALQKLTEADFPLALTSDHWVQVTIHGVDVFDPNTGEVRSDSASGIACWFLDSDYNEESFFVRHAYFLGQNDPYKSLKTTLKAEINEEAWGTLNSDTSRPFIRPESGRIAIKVINHLGDEVMKVMKV
ncbi:MAG: site-specific DNA-methyltransferase [Chlorobi bacterium]|nr:site-specific DNA-methyltransferase [Chlorobiota bacterium]